MNGEYGFHTRPSPPATGHLNPAMPDPSLSHTPCRARRSVPASSSPAWIVATDLRADLLRAAETAAPITRTTPRLSWAQRSDAPGERQTAFEVRVAHTAGELEASPQWTSGKVISPETAVSVAAGVLCPGRAYVWTVRLWNAADERGPVSDPARFLTASTLDPDAYPPRPRQVRTPVAPVELIRKSAGHVFLDFGRAAFGTIRFREKGSA